MEVDHHCTPEEAHVFLVENHLNCNLHVLGCQLGLKPSDLDTLLAADQSRPYQQLPFQILSRCSEEELLSWIKLVSVLRKPALKQYIGLQIRYAMHTGLATSPEDSIASLQSPWSGLEASD